MVTMISSIIDECSSGLLKFLQMCSCHKMPLIFYLKWKVFWWGFFALFMLNSLYQNGMIFSSGTNRREKSKLFFFCYKEESLIY